MMMSIVIALAVAGNPDIAVQSVPIENEGAMGLLVAVDSTGAPRLMVVDNQTVTIYPDASTEPALMVPLPEGTSAVDVFDINGDGHTELLAVHGTEVLAFDLADPASPRTLFHADTPLAETRPQPFPYVLALEWKDRVAIALPRKLAIELWSPDGTLLEKFAAQDAAAVDYGRPLSVRSIEPSQAGGANSLELRVSMVRDMTPDLPESVQPPQSLTAGRPGTLSHAREATLGDPGNWPWFPLQAASENADRVLYALEPPEFRDTVVRIRRAAPEPADGSNDETYRYPGALIPYGEQALPDFSGDGFVDLILWKAPVPGGSVDTLARAATGRTWPLTTTVHLFNPQKGRFDARPSSPVKHHVNVAWFMTTEQGSPLRHVVFEDFDGDGKSDLGCSADPQSFAIWYYRDGFNPAPDFKHEFPAPLVKLDAICAPVETPVTLLLFRSPHMLHLLRVTR